MPPPPDRIFAVARMALSVIEDAYEEASVDMPQRRAVVGGNAIYDCEQLTVQAERVYGINATAAVENPAEEDCLGMRAVLLAITTLRCVPNISDRGKAPKVELLEASALRELGDPTIQWNALRQARKSGALAPFNHGLAFAGWQAIGPDGGLGGGTLRVRWTLTAGPVIGS